MVCTWLREICSCSCLAVMPCPAWVLLSKIYIPYLGALYRGELKGLYVLLSRTQAEPGITVKQEQEENSHNHIHLLNLCIYNV